MLYTQEEEEEDIDGVPMNSSIPMMDFSEHMVRLAQGQNYDGVYNNPTHSATNVSSADVVRGMTVADRIGYVYNHDEDIDGVPLDEGGEGDSVDGVPL